MYGKVNDYLNISMELRAESGEIDWEIGGRGDAVRVQMRRDPIAECRMRNAEF